MSLHGEMPRDALSSSLGELVHLELLLAHTCPYFYLLINASHTGGLPDGSQSWRLLSALHS